MPITGAIRGTYKGKLYQEIGLVSLQLRCCFRKLCSFHKNCKINQPSYLANIVPQQNFAFNIKNVDKVPLLKIKYNFFKKLFFL